MPCTVKCRCGKAQMRFNKLKAGDIEAFECPACSTDVKTKPKEQAPRIQSNPYGKSQRNKNKDVDKAPDAEKIAEIESEKAED